MKSLGWKAFSLCKSPQTEHSVGSSQSFLSKSLEATAEQSRGTSLWQWRTSWLFKGSTRRGGRTNLPIQLWHWD